MRRAWYRFKTFAPSGDHLRDAGIALTAIIRTGDVLLKAAAIGAWFYFAIEIGHGLLRHFGGR